MSVVRRGGGSVVGLGVGGHGGVLKHWIVHGIRRRGGLALLLTAACEFTHEAHAAAATRAATPGATLFGVFLEVKSGMRMSVSECV